MTEYNLIFSIVTLSSLYEILSKKNNYLLILLLITLFFFSSTRYWVGGDWWNYMDMFYNSNLLDVYGDIGYNYINVLFNSMGFSFTSILLFCSFFFFIALYIFLKDFHYPLFGLMIATPILIYNFHFGNIRQTTALAFLLISLYFLNKNKLLYFLFFLIACLFHKTAVIFSIIYLFNLDFKKIKKAVFSFLIISFIVILVSLFYLNFILNLIDIYLISKKIPGSSGAYPRVLLQLIPIIFSIFYLKDLMNYKDYKIWFMLSIFIMIVSPLVFFFSTTIDRIFVYFMPLQLILWDRILFLSNKNLKIYIFIFVTSLFWLAYFIWFWFGGNSGSWTPYSAIYYNNDQFWYQFMFDHYQDVKIEKPSRNLSILLNE